MKVPTPLAFVAACTAITPLAQEIPAPSRQPVAPPTPPAIVEAASTQLPEPPLHATATLYSIGDPSPEEQLYIEMINRARANPAAEALLFVNSTDPRVLGAYDFFDVDLNLLVTQFATIAPAPPLAPNALLTDAARRHTQDMFDNSFQGHTGTDGTSASQRITQAGYTWRIIAENVYASAADVFHGHAGFEVDWGFGPGGMQTPPGHRNNIHDARFREIGVGVVLGFNQSEPGSQIPGTLDEVGPQLVTQELASRQGDTPLITGVVYFDLNENNFYDIGEGVGGVNVAVSGTATQAVTARSGGYAIPVSGNGSYTITFSGPNLTGSSQQVTIADALNQKADFRPAYTPPGVTGPASPGINNPNSYTITPVPAAAAYQWRNFQLVTPALEGAENGASNVTINQVGAYDVIQTATKKTGTAAFQLATPTGETQSIELKPAFLITSGTTLRFQSRLGWAAVDTHAKVEISTDDGTSWQEVFRQLGTANEGETSFNARSANLSPFAGQVAKIRFVFQPNTSFYPQTSSGVGWFIDDILLDGGSQIANEQVSAELSPPSFTFQPTAQANFVLQARARTGHSFLPWGPMLNVQSVPGTVTSPTLQMGAISIANGRAIIEIDVTSGTPPLSWTLQSKATLNDSWATASTAVEVLSPTKVRFNVLARASDTQRFYRVSAN
jgi:hypothetical protein